MNAIRLVENFSTYKITPKSPDVFIVKTYGILDQHYIPIKLGNRREISFKTIQIIPDFRNYGYCILIIVKEDEFWL